MYRLREYEASTSIAVFEECLPAPLLQAMSKGNVRENNVIKVNMELVEPAQFVEGNLYTVFCSVAKEITKGDKPILRCKSRVLKSVKHLNVASFAKALPIFRNRFCQHQPLIKLLQHALTQHQ